MPQKPKLDRIDFRQDDRSVWAVFDLPKGYLAELRLVLAKGQTVVGELCVKPSKTIPAGGLGSTTLRDVPLREMLTSAIEFLLSIPKRPPNWPDFWAELTTDFALPKRTLQPPPHPGRRGHTDEYLARLAARYVDLVHHGVSKPAYHLAKELGIAQESATQLIHRLRQRDFLSAAPPGRAGGSLRPKARKILDKEQRTRRKS